MRKKQFSEGNINCFDEVDENCYICPGEEPRAKILGPLVVDRLQLGKCNFEKNQQSKQFDQKRIKN